MVAFIIVVMLLYLEIKILLSSPGVNEVSEYATLLTTQLFLFFV